MLTAYRNTLMTSILSHEVFTLLYPMLDISLQAPGVRNSEAPPTSIS